MTMIGTETLKMYRKEELLETLNAEDARQNRDRAVQEAAARQSRHIEEWSREQNRRIADDAKLRVPSRQTR